MDFPPADIPAPLLRLTNQVFDLEQQLGGQPADPKLGRILHRMQRELQALGLSYHSPLGESYDETRTDCEATLTGEAQQGLKVLEVIKPIIRYQGDSFPHILQRAVVIVGASEG